jgi:hypothetical protein
MDIMLTYREFETVMAKCRNLYLQKMHDYGCAWRIMRPSSITDQIYIKANRIHTLHDREAMVDEGIVSEFVAIVNYSVMGLIQLELGFADRADLDEDAATALYDRHAGESLELMKRKNHDYGEAWRGMRVSSMADMILMKVYRTKQIEDLEGETLVSEGVAANYMDMMNYAVFALIKLGVASESDSFQS